MIITIDKINDCNIESVQENKKLLIALLKDLDEINRKTKNTYYIYVQDYHNEYSPERTDPCPDYFGYFKIVIIENNEIIYYFGEFMTVNDLDFMLFFFWQFVCESGEFTKR